MTPEDKTLVDIFMKAQAEHDGLTFSENVLSGLKAVLDQQNQEFRNRSIKSLEGLLEQFQAYRNGWLGTWADRIGLQADLQMANSVVQQAKGEA
jgi:hypothetical protein